MFIVLALFTCILFYAIDRGDSMNKSILQAMSNEYVIVSIYTLTGSLGSSIVYKLLRSKTKYASIISYISVPFITLFVPYIIMMIVRIV